MVYGKYLLNELSNVNEYLVSVGQSQNEVEKVKMFDHCSMTKLKPSHREKAKTKKPTAQNVRKFGQD